MICIFLLHHFQGLPRPISDFLIRSISSYQIGKMGKKLYQPFLIILSSTNSFNFSLSLTPMWAIHRRNRENGKNCNHFGLQIFRPKFKMRKEKTVVCSSNLVPSTGQSLLVKRQPREIYLDIKFASYSYHRVTNSSSNIRLLCHVT